MISVKNKRILLVGASGVLGSQYARSLSENGAKLIMSDLKNLKQFSSKLKFYYGDLRNFSSLESAIANNDIIFHVAADYRLWSRNPRELYDSNVRGTENVCKLVNKYKKVLIYTSSVATLGISNEKESDENTPVTYHDMIGDYKKSK